MIRVRCEICENVIATADPATLRAPLDSSMFGPPEGGFETPWMEDVPWLHLYCPYCSYRAFLRDDTVWTEDRQYVTAPLATEAVAAEIDSMAQVVGGEQPQESLEDAVKRLAKDDLTATAIGNQLGVTRQKVVAALRK